MNEHGFTLVELLVAAVIALFITAGAMLLADAGRTAFAVEPATLDTVRRLRDGASTLSSAIGAAGGDLGIGRAHGSLASALPVLRLTQSVSAAAFDGLVVLRAVRGGRGQLVEPQDGPAGSLMLANEDGLCPRPGDVCGFSVGDVAVVFDDRGHHDVFIVGAVSEALLRVTPRDPLSYAYPAGSFVVEARQERLVLAPQPDGTRTLVRHTAAGAQEPMVDGVVGLRMVPWGRAAPPRLDEGDADGPFAQYGLAPVRAEALDPEALFGAGEHCLALRGAVPLRSTLQPHADQGEGLSELSPEDMNDGPWCPHADNPERFDADWFRVRRVDIALEVAVLVPQLRGVSGRLFAQGGTGAHAASTWVHDRRIRLTVAVGR